MRPSEKRDESSRIQPVTSSAKPTKTGFWKRDSIKPLTGSTKNKGSSDKTSIYKKLRDGVGRPPLRRPLKRSPKKEKPVSYTHLDVYKRQGRLRQPARLAQDGLLGAAGDGAALVQREGTEVARCV